MPGKKSDRIKIYFVIALAIFAASVAYFSFFYKKGPSVPVPGPAIAPVADLKVPKIDVKITKTNRLDESVIDEFRSTDIRDIFSHLKMLTKIVPEEAGEVAEIPKPSFTLKGTILDGKNPVAIINDKFLRTGDRISGYEVVRISKNEVLLNSGDYEIVLEVISAVLK